MKIIKDIHAMTTVKPRGGFYGYIPIKCRVRLTIYALVDLSLKICVEYKGKKYAKKFQNRVKDNLLEYELSFEECHCLTDYEKPGSRSRPISMKDPVEVEVHEFFGSSLRIIVNFPDPGVDEWDMWKIRERDFTIRKFDD